jgi:hypothetical protein
MGAHSNITRALQQIHLSCEHFIDDIKLLNIEHNDHLGRVIIQLRAHVVLEIILASPQINPTVCTVYSRNFHGIFAQRFQQTFSVVKAVAEPLYNYTWQLRHAVCQTLQRHNRHDPYYFAAAQVETELSVMNSVPRYELACPGAEELACEVVRYSIFHRKRVLRQVLASLPNIMTATLPPVAQYVRD